MKQIKNLILVCLVSLGSYAIQAQEADSIVGKYLPPEKDSVIEVFKCGAKYCGRTFCIKDNAYKESEKENGVVGTPYLDHNNEDTKLRKRPNLGMEFLTGFDYEGEGLYKNGKVYNPRDGKTYCAKMTLIDPNKLALKGHICGISFLGKTNEWARLTGINLDDPKWDCMGKTKK